MSLIWYECAYQVLISFESGMLKSKQFRSPDFTCPWDPHRHSFQVWVDQEDSPEESDQIKVKASIAATSRVIFVRKAKFQLLDMENDTKDEVYDCYDFAEYDATSLGGHLKVNAKCDRALLSVYVEYAVDDRDFATVPYDLEDDATKMSNELSALMGDATDAGLSDVTLIVDDQELACHRAILMTRSQYFRALLGQPGFRESGKERVAIVEPRFDLLKVAIRFLYDGAIRDEDLTPICLELIPVADKYLVEDLREACELLACSPDVVTSANVLDALGVAHQHNCDTLFKFCVPIFVASKSALMRSEKWLELKHLDGLLERLIEAIPSVSIPNISQLKYNMPKKALSRLANDMEDLFEVHTHITHISYDWC